MKNLHGKRPFRIIDKQRLYDKHRTIHIKTKKIRH